MRMPFILAAGLVLLATQAMAQSFQVEDVPSVSAVGIGQLKPNTIAFTDKGSDDIFGAGAIFSKYEDWAKAKPIQQQYLSLYPGYTEPNGEIVVDGVKRRLREPLHMYVVEARFVIAKPPGSFDLAQFATLPFAQQLDPAIKHRVITAADVVRPKDIKAIHNQNPQRRWCEGRPVMICLHSTYRLEGRLPVGIALANKIRDASKKVSDTLEFDGELTVVPPEEATERRFADLTGINTPVAGAIEQSIFYVNQVMQFGKLVAVFQSHPTDPGKTVASVFMSLAIESNVLVKRKEYAQVPVLRNMVPAQVLAGKSSFNSGSSLSAGLPVYARNQVKALASILERNN